MDRGGGWLRERERKRKGEDEGKEEMGVVVWYVRNRGLC